MPDVSHCGRARHHANGRHRAPSGRTAALSRLPRLATIGTLAAGLALGMAPIALASPATAATVHTATRVSTATTATIGVGARGTAVRWVQATLGVTPRTGYYGPLTRAAVTRFQKAHHLRATGSVNAATWKALRASAARTSVASRSSQRLMLPRGLQAVKVASTYAGVRYRYGGTSPAAGFDCSGYVGYVYRQLGVTLPRSAAGIYARAHTITKAQARPGDLVFVHKNGRISHVAIYAGANMWWEASRPGTPTGKHKAWTSHVSYGRLV